MIEWILLALAGGAAYAAGSKKDGAIGRGVVGQGLGAAGSAEYSSDDGFQKALAAWRLQWETTIDRNRWIPNGTAERIIAKYPPPKRKRHFFEFLPHEDLVLNGLQAEFADHNQTHLAERRASLGDFFNTVERNPLTDEQVLACVCMDNAVQIVAAAGSGKTSTMVAKAGYAIKEGIARPNQILLLAFNTDAATELQDRVRDRLAEFDSMEDVKARTFHSFGLKVIATATGEKPSLARWLEQPGKDIEKIVEIVENLRKADAIFRGEWDLFRMVFGRDIGKWGDPISPDAYQNGRRGFRTAGGDVVKSKEERLIADWLFYHSVAYEYERDYEHKTADEHHRQYRPDFYYPDIQLYHEHFALDASGRSPDHFGPGYLEGVKWKRQLHAEMGTGLIETASHEISNGRAFDSLRSELENRGVEIRFDGSRKPSGSQPVSNQELARIVRVFQQHVKGSGQSRDDVVAALQTRAAKEHDARLSMFVSLYLRISQEWERLLAEANCVDFEDMLSRAASHIEKGEFASPFTMVLSDEFQDSSRARIRLLKALKGANEAVHLCVVGDDWQGINRFAGADIAIMTEFERIFEHATRLTLSTTFRCPPRLCDISSDFIQANPAQIKKTISTINSYNKTPVIVFGFSEMGNSEAHLHDQLAEMYGYAQAGKLQGDGGRKISVLLLGRYRDIQPKSLGHWRKQFGDSLDIDYRTVHASKGLEADYVMLLNMVEDTRGFPSQIEDDPVLQIAMPTPDPFPMSEERRLFYVALTRAKRQIRIYTSLSNPSRFLVELVEKGAISIDAVDGEPPVACPVCKVGVIKLRNGAFGCFQSCSTWPRCEFKADLVDKAGPPAELHRVKGKVLQGSVCPTCGTGSMNRVDGRRGRFLGCSEFPKCKTIARFSY